MALWGNNDNVNALGVAGAGVVTLDYSTLEVVGTATSFGTSGYAKTGDVIRFGMSTDSGTYFGDAAIVGIASTTVLTIASTMGLSGAAIASTVFQISELPQYTTLQPWYSMDSDVNREDPSYQTVFVGTAYTAVGVGTSAIGLDMTTTHDDGRSKEEKTAFDLYMDGVIQIGDQVTIGSDELDIVSIGTAWVTANHASPGAAYTVYMNGGYLAIPSIDTESSTRFGAVKINGSGDEYGVTGLGATGISLGSTVPAVSSGAGLLFETSGIIGLSGPLTGAVTAGDTLTFKRWIGGNHKKVFGVSGIGVSAALGTQYETGGGWVGVQTYYDTDGNYRVKKEILVAMSGIQTGNQPVYPTVS